MYVLLVVFPWMATSRAELLRSAKGFVVVSCIGFVFFLVVPVQGPRPAVAGQNLMFRMLESYDRPLNCFPSLHVGLAVYTVLSAGGILDGRLSAGIRRTILSLAWLWTGLIAYAALATKQHYAVDLPAGALLAYICHAHAWHHTQRSTAHAEPPIVHADLSRDSLGALVRRPDSHLGPDASAVGRQ